MTVGTGRRARRLRRRNPGSAAHPGTIPAGAGGVTDGPCRRPGDSPNVRMDRVLQEVALTGAVGDLAAVEVADVAFDHRAVRPGALYCCVPGQRTDGHRFAGAAVAAGAVGLLADRPVDVPVPQAIVPSGGVRPAMAAASCRLWGDPSRRLVTVGVTGTNGKTSVTHLLAAAFEAAGRRTAVIGTLSGARTTPEAPDLQRRLAQALSDGDQAATIEVSSHALVQHRVGGTHFAAGVFTNLAHDHLDFHGSMAAYFEAKAALFEQEDCALAVVNRDDPWGRQLLERLSGAGRPVVSYGADDATDVETGRRGSAFTWRGQRVALALPGLFQVHNALAAASTAEALGLATDEVAAGLAAAGPVPGRFQVVAGPPETAATVVVDFAHTPDALRAALASARRLAGEGRLVCVFGCGGDRDRAKRGVMGAVAAEGADVVVVTSDNARSEAPGAIIDDVLAGVAGVVERGTGPEVVVEEDRRRAIEQGLRRAGAGDVVLVAGKGHETTMESGGRVVPFDDRVVAAELAAELARGGAR